MAAVLSGAALESPPVSRRVVRPGAGNRLRALRRLLAPALWLGLRLLRLRFPRDWFRALLFLRELGGRCLPEAGDTEAKQPDPFRRASPALGANEIPLFQTRQQLDHPPPR